MSREDSPPVLASTSKATLASFEPLLASILAAATSESVGDARRAQAALALREMYAATCEACGAASRWRRGRAAAIEAEAKAAKAAKAQVTA